MGHTRGRVAALLLALASLAGTALAGTACGGPEVAPPEPLPGGFVPATDRPGPARACGASGGTPLCLSAPSARLSGEVAVTVTADAGVDELEFSWGATPETAEHLLTDFDAPWEFRWPTASHPDGAGYLVVRAAPAATGLGQPVALRLTLANGGAANGAAAGGPANGAAAGDTGAGAGVAADGAGAAAAGAGGGLVAGGASDWSSRFRPRPLRGGRDPVIAAVGDGGDGGPTSDAVAAYLERSRANMLLYLGDIYERGTAAEWDNNFGTASWFDPAGRGRGWGRMAAFTQPVIGNHEAHHREVWRSYWRGRPDWTTLVYGGVRFLLLDSECGRSVGPQDCGPGSPQYNFVARVLAANTHRCVVAVWHRPVLSPGPPAPVMRPLWRLVASHGADLVLNGHQHHMQIYRPLDGELRAGRPDSHLVQLVSGGGGHIPHRDVSNDPRSRWQAMGVPGALFITAHGGGGGPATRLSYTFRDLHDRVVRTQAGAGTGAVTC
jgi:hypothetical protein